MAAPADALIGIGTSIAFYSDTTSGTASTNAMIDSKLIDLDGPDWSATEINTSDQAITDRYMTYKQGMIDAGHVEATFEFDPALACPCEATPASAVGNHQGTLVITWPDLVPGAATGLYTYTCKAFCSGYAPSSPLDDKLTVRARFKLSGKPTVAST